MPNGRHVIAVVVGGMSLWFASSGNADVKPANNSGTPNNVAPQHVVTLPPSPPARPSPYRAPHDLAAAPTPAPPVTPAPPPPTSTDGGSKHDHSHDHDHDGDTHRRDRPHAGFVGERNFVGTGDEGYPGDSGSDVGPRPPVPPLQTDTPPASQQQPSDPVAAAMKAFNDVCSQLQLQFEASPGYLNAVADRRAAEKALDEAEARAELGLKNDPEYQKAIAEKDKAAAAVAAAQIEARHATATTEPTTQPAPIAPDLFRAAQAKLAATSKLAAVEGRLIDQNPDVVAAQDRLDAALKVESDVKREFAAAVRKDPSWIAARQRVEAARSASAMGQ